MRRLAAAVIVVFLLTSVPATAQLWDRFTNPKVEVTLTHPPGFRMNVKRIAFAAANRHECTDTFIDGLVEDFTDQGMDVVDRQHLESILAEQRLSLSAFTDESSSARFGKLLGPAAVLYVKMSRCKAEMSHRTESGGLLGTTNIYVSVTTGKFKGSVQAVDTTTGRIMKARQIDVSVPLEARSTDGFPEYPSEDDAFDRAEEAAVLQVHRLFFTWTEPRSLYFFDDVPCGLKNAFLIMQRGDVQGALEASRSNASNCMTATGMKPKVQWHALYNVGMANFALGEYDEALTYLNQAASAGGGDIVQESIIECQRAKALAEDLAKVEAKPTLTVDVPAGEPSNSRPAPAAMPVSARAAAPRPAASGGGKASADDEIELRLKKLKNMLDKGLISKEDYEKKKAELLKSM